MCRPGLGSWSTRVAWKWSRGLRSLTKATPHSCFNCSISCVLWVHPTIYTLLYHRGSSDHFRLCGSIFTFIVLDIHVHSSRYSRLSDSIFTIVQATVGIPLWPSLRTRSHIHTAKVRLYRHCATPGDVNSTKESRGGFNLQAPAQDLISICTPPLRRA